MASTFAFIFSYTKLEVNRLRLGDRAAAYPLGAFELGKLASTVYLQTSTKDFDLVSVHRYDGVRPCSNKRNQAGSQVLAIKILAFSNRLGQFTPMVLSRMKPE